MLRAASVSILDQRRGSRRRRVAGRPPRQASVLVSSVHATQRGLRRRRSVRSAGRNRCAVEQTSRVSRDPVARTMLTKVADDPAVHPIQAMRPVLHSPCSTDVATCGRVSRDSVTALGYGTSSAASGAIPSQRRTGATRRMTNASVANSASSTPWHAVFAGYGDLEEATSSGSQVRVCEAPLATALDQRHEMTSHRAPRRSCWCRPSFTGASLDGRDSSRLTSASSPRGSPDREASTGSACSPTLIIPTKASWTNCRYEDRGKGRTRGHAGASTGGGAPVDASRAADIDSQLLRADGDERGENRDVARTSASAADGAGRADLRPHAGDRPSLAAFRDRQAAGDERPSGRRFGAVRGLGRPCRRCAVRR